MGTRNLTMVISNNQTKVAQYGQWDGYPDGVGLGVLEFIRGVDLPEFKKNIDKIKWLTDEQIDEINKTESWDTKYPYLSRDASSEVLNAIHYGKMNIGSNYNGVSQIDVSVIGLLNKEGFAKDSLFCEWGYVIDLDKNSLDVYTGFQKEKQEGNIFGENPNEGGYYPIAKIASFDLKDLPSNDDFLEVFSKLEGEEED